MSIADEYAAWKQAKDRLSTLEQLAAARGMSKQLYLYYAKQKGPGATTHGADDQSCAEATVETDQSDCTSSL